MPIFTIPVHETPLQEFNPCHQPGGTPAGGQFAAKGTGNCGPEGQSAQESGLTWLKDRWSKVNNELLEFIDRPVSQESTMKVAEQAALVKEMYRLDVDRGGVEGIGKPGGARDVVIVGAGPAGLSAAIAGGTEGLDTLYIDAADVPGGQPKFTTRVENYPGFEIGLSGPHLIADMVGQARRAGADEMLGVKVTSLSVDEKTGLKTLTLSNGETITSRAVILAMGVAPNKLPPFKGDTSPDVFYQGQSPPSDVAGKPVVIIGGSNGAAQAALGAARKAASVTILSRSPITKAMSSYQIGQVKTHPKITIVEGDEISELVTDQRGRALTVVTKAGRRIPASSLGVYAGGKSPTGWLPVTLKRTKGRIDVDSSLRTNLPGVYAVGDVRTGAGQRIVTAAGDGQLAVKDIFGYFTEAYKSKG